MSKAKDDRDEREIVTWQVGIPCTVAEFDIFSKAVAGYVKGRWVKAAIIEKLEREKRK